MSTSGRKQRRHPHDHWVLEGCSSTHFGWIADVSFSAHDTARTLLKAAAVRAVRTVVVLSDVNWVPHGSVRNPVLVGSGAALAGVLSLLTSIAGLPEVE